jgi:demethylmenaquinone methyltransferase / 2-methoxy-6-polyprenyl-1,4-benzoquinol methylase
MISTARPSGQGSPLSSGRDEASAGAAVRSMFTAVAHRYDFLNHFLSLGRDIAWRKAAALALKDILTRPGSRVADLCCGTGDLSFCLGRHSQGLVVGVDFCPPMLAIARAKAGPRVHFFEADALHLPFADASLDAVTSAFGFRNLVHYERGLDEMRRVLRNGGRHSGVLTCSLARFRNALSILLPPRSAPPGMLDFGSRRSLPLPTRVGAEVSRPRALGGNPAPNGFRQGEL